MPGRIGARWKDWLTERGETGPTCPNNPGCEALSPLHGQTNQARAERLTMTYQIIDDDVQTSGDVIRRVLKVVPADGSEFAVPVEHELGAAEVTTLAWPTTGRVIELGECGAVDRA
jgi:hypothetical protein